jgi:hypothetical protein
MGSGNRSDGTLGSLLEAFEEPAYLCSASGTPLLSNQAARARGRHPEWLSAAARGERPRDTMLVQRLALDEQRVLVVLARSGSALGFDRPGPDSSTRVTRSRS